MAQTPEEEPKVPTTLAGLIKETTYTPGSYKAPNCPPAMDPYLQLKWGLTLLGEEKALEYLKWLGGRLDNGFR